MGATGPTQTPLFFSHFRLFGKYFPVDLSMTVVVAAAAAAALTLALALALAGSLFRNHLLIFSSSRRRWTPSIPGGKAGRPSP